MAVRKAVDNLRSWRYCVVVKRERRKPGEIEIPLAREP